ncbi:hypothetical protein GCM10027075_72880 [Streptomyces heilongjiangensis]
MVWPLPEVAPVAVVPQLTATAESPSRERNWRRVDAVMAMEKVLFERMGNDVESADVPSEGATK